MAGRRKKGKMISEFFFLFTLIMQCHEVFKRSFHNRFLIDIKGCPTPEVVSLCLGRMNKQYCIHGIACLNHSLDFSDCETDFHICG